MSLRAKLVAALIAAALILVVAAFSLRALRLSQLSGLWVEHTHEVIDQTVLVQTKLLDAAIGQRSYLLTGDDRYLDPYELAVESLPSDLDRLEALTVDNPKQQANVAMLRQAATASFVPCARAFACAPKRARMPRSRCFVPTGSGPCKRCVASLRRCAPRRRACSQTG